MVALSVSISAKISPSETVSPTFLSQLATVPSSMVSLRRGMVIISTPAGNSAGVAGAVSVSAVDVFVSSVAGAESPESSAVISSPFSPIIASSASTGAVSPSCIPMCRSSPS